MKSTPKSLLTFLAVFLLVTSTKNLFAQHHSSDVARQNGQRQAALWTSMNPNKPQLWIWGTGGKAKYQVTFRDSSIKEVLSYMYTDTISHQSYLAFEDKKFPKSDTLHRNQKIYANQTLYISTITDFDSKTEAYGVPTDSCWMFKVMDGPISVYAKSWYYLTLAANGNEAEFDRWEIVGIQLNDGPIVKLTDDNLKQMVGQDTNALESLEKKKYYKAVKKYNRHAEKGDKKATPVSGE